MSFLWRNRDILLRCNTRNLRITGIIASATIAEASKHWGLSPQSDMCQLWGEYMAGTAMLGAFYKGEERIKLQFRSQAVSELFVEAMAIGEVRGRVQTVKGSSVDVGEDSMHSSANGGSLQIDKILYGAAKPYTTHISATGVPHQDFENYYRRSEQVPTLVRIHSGLKDGRIRCCGITIQEMPASIALESTYNLHDLHISEFHFSSDTENAQDFTARLNNLLNSSLTSEEVEKIPLDFFCRCSKQRFAERIVQLPKESVLAIRNDVKTSRKLILTCQFCNKTYEFVESELEKLQWKN